MGARDSYVEAARNFGTALGDSGLELVYGGASVGLMGAIANSALAAGGKVTGIIPKALDSREIAHPGLTKLEVVETMLERKARMTELADGFVALPGGGGTLDELFEVFTWAQLGMHSKPIVLYQIDGYFDALLQFVQHSVNEGFISKSHGGLLSVGRDPDQVLAALRVAPNPQPSYIDEDDL